MSLSAKTPLKTVLAIALCLACFTAGPTFSNEDGGGSDLNLKSTYSQAEFVRLSREELRALGRSMVNIIGFDFWGESNILQPMIQVHSSAAKRLVREMMKIKGKQQRIKRLRVEKDRVNKDIKKVEASIKRLEGKSSRFAEAAAEAERVRLADLKKYQKAVDRWIANPNQGLYEGA